MDSLKSQGFAAKEAQPPSQHQTSSLNMDVSKSQGVSPLLLAHFNPPCSLECSRRVHFHHKTTTSCWLPTSPRHCKTLFVGFRLVQVLCFLQVSFSSYSPAYYPSGDGGDHVDGYVFTNYTVHDIVFVLRFMYAYTVSAVFLLR